jgi:hypothetical protein
MTKRFQVFVSSTYEDLKEERSRIITALLNINCIPCGMEYFPAADEDAWNCIERLVPECDYYVLILAGMYGSIPEGQQKSFTHLEYELAVKHQVPVIGLLHRDPRKLPVERCESQPARRKKLEQFRKQAGRKLCRYWQSADQLPGELLASLTHQLNRFPRPGWVRADSLASEEAKDEIIKLQKKVEKQAKLIEDFQTREAGEEQQLASGDEEIIFIGTLLQRSHWPWSKCGTFMMSTTWNALLSFMHRGLHLRWDDEELESLMASSLEKAAYDETKRNLSIAFDDGELRKVIVQFTALQLIVAKNDYNEFSAKGVVEASRLRAIRKGQSSANDSAVFRIGWKLDEEKSGKEEDGNEPEVW